MLFNSTTFIVFFAIVWAVYSLPISWRAKKFHLLVSSYVFYAAWNPPFVILIWISTLVDWWAARGLARYDKVSTRRWLLGASLGANLGMLGFFKYGGFLLESFAVAAARVGIQYQAPDLGIVLPVGISFYTFQTLSYTFDVYRRELEPCPSFLDFALFVTFFPQLVAGPIVRAKEFLPQLRVAVRATSRQMGWGLTILTIGLFEKVVLADSFLAPVAEAVYDAGVVAGAQAAWVGTLAFTMQIFFDFAGYSLCAIGTAMCLGFALPDNFRAPYAAIGFADLWRRWHISLSSWIRDYVYISIGGGRAGMLRVSFNIMVTMLLCGLWHGAGWRFVLWGGLHGLFLVGERLVKQTAVGARWLAMLPGRALLAAVTFACWNLAFVFFRSQNVPAGIALLKTMFGFTSGGLTLDVGRITITVVITVVTLSFQWATRDRALEDLWAKRGTVTRAVLLAAMLSAIIFSPGEDRAFIYFQF